MFTDKPDRFVRGDIGQVPGATVRLLDKVTVGSRDAPVLDPALSFEPTEGLDRHGATQHGGRRAVKLQKIDTVHGEALGTGADAGRERLVGVAVWPVIVSARRSPARLRGDEYHRQNQG